MEAEVENETMSESEDEKANKFPILPSGDGDVKLNNDITALTDVKKNTIKSKNNSGATDSSTKSSKWTKFSRLLKIGAPDLTPNDAPASDENMEKYKRHSLGKIFRQGMNNLSRNTYCEEAKGDAQYKNASGKFPEQTRVKFLGSWMNSLQRGSRQTGSCQFAALASKEGAADGLPKDHGGSLGKFFRFKQGKKYNPMQKTSELSELSKTPSSEFVSLPLEPPLEEQYEEGNEPLALKMGSGCPFFINNEEVN